MTTAKTVPSVPAGLTGTWFSGAIEQAKTRYRQYRKFRHTLAELQALSDRELRDIGLSRTMARAVAREAAYGD